MWRYKGFKSKEAAKEFAKKTGHGYIVERDGKRKQEYKDINLFGGNLDTEKYPFAITWRE